MIGVGGENRLRVVVLPISKLGAPIYCAELRGAFEIVLRCVRDLGSMPA